MICDLYIRHQNWEKTQHSRLVPGKFCVLEGNL